MNDTLKFPTLLHEQAAKAAYRFFQPLPAVDTVLVTNSCARGQAVPESDLDMLVLVKPDTPDDEIRRLEALWQEHLTIHPTLRAYRQSGEHAHVHLDLFNGEFILQPWDDGGGPDAFEIAIGNTVAYAAPLHAAGPYFHELQARWLPYYPEDLRTQRLISVREACAYDLGHVPFFVGRQLYFQAFDRLYKAFQEFLQAVFIARRVYPLAYNKWIRMQVEDWLGLPELYQALPPILSVSNIESDALNKKADALRYLLMTWTQEGRD